MHDDHASKRETLLGRWVPVALYSLNLLLWIITATEAGRGDLLWLALFAVPALGLYLWRPHRTVA